MTLQGIAILIMFLVFAGLMIAKKLPTLLALPLMATAMCVIAGMPFPDFINAVVSGGSVKMASSISVVVFGAIFARIIMKTGISNAIIKNAAELAGDRPLPIAATLTTAIAFIFLGMNGLGAIIMIGSIAIPIMTAAGIKPVTAASLLLLGMQTGLAANAANYGAFIGIFGGDVVSSFYAPAFIISAIATAAFIIINVRPQRERSAWAAPDASAVNGRKDKKVPAMALIAPVIPIVTFFIFKAAWGFGAADKGMLDAVGTSIFGFILASLYAIVMTQPERAANIFSGAIVEGIQDIAGVIFLFIGIGMLVSSVTSPAVAKLLNPIINDLVPSGRAGVLIFFTLLSPLALYRGPLNMFGMGAGVAALLVSLKILPLAALAGAFVAVQYVQAVSDPTNSQNVWTAEYSGEDTTAILKATLPYTWLMCVAMLVLTIFTKW
ncbi:MAG TPA: transporter [Candidatus Wallbacteria bacterium]|nr:transporter [Candidatus Wallbacteria bacterium]